MKVILLSAVLLASARGFFWSNPVEDLSGYSHDDGYLAFWYAFAAQCDYSSVLETWTNGVPHAPDDMVGFQLYDVIRTVGVLPGGLQSYVGWDNTRQRIVVAFRGSDNADNWIRTNLNLIPDSYPNAAELSDPKLHPGFYGAFKELEEAGIVTAMGELTAQHPGANVLVTGHSLGGALASIAALEFVLSPVYSDMDIGRVDIITFGSVRVFNEELATHFNDVMDSSWRIVNRYDLAVTVPIKAMGYYHVGTEVWYNYRRWWWEIDELEYRVCDGSGEDTTCFGTDFWADRIPMWTHHSQYMGMQTDPRKDMICRSAPGSITAAKKTDIQEDGPMFGVNSLKAKKETKAREDGDAMLVPALSSANKAEINEIGTSDITLIANWATIVSTGLGIVGLGNGDYGAHIRIYNYLCGGELRAKAAFYLVKGSFRAHCETVRSGTSAGCTATGEWNRGLYGMVQYNFLTAVPGYEQCAALNVFVQASQGWFGINSVDVSWSTERCSHDETADCIRRQRRLRDGRQCWTSDDTYDWDCTSDWDDASLVTSCNGLEAVARIGDDNNPTVTIAVRATSDPIGTCGHPGS